MIAGLRVRRWSIAGAAWLVVACSGSGSSGVGADGLGGKGDAGDGGDSASEPDPEDAAEGPEDAATELEGAVEPDGDSGTNEGDAGELDASVGKALYVEPIVGDDAQLGTLEAPLKTIAYAASIAAAGDTIWLLDGTYEPATEPRFLGSDAAPCGAASGIVVPSGVTVRALHDGLAVLRVSAPHGFCMTGGALIGLDLGHVRPSGRIVEVSAGSVLIEGTRFTNAGTGGGGGEAAVYATGSAQVTVRPGALDNLLGSPSYAFAAAREQSRITVSGATLKGAVGDAYSGNALFAAGDAGELVLDGVSVSDARWAVIVSLADDAKATLQAGTSLVGRGPSAQGSGVHMLGRSTLILDGATLSEFASGIYSNIYEPVSPTIVATNAVLSRNTYGVNFGGDTSVQRADCSFVGGRIEANTGAGFRSNVPGTYRFDGTVITINGARGLDFWNVANDYDVTLRRSSLLGNGSSGLFFAGAVGSSLDLGTLAEPGANTLTGNNGSLVANEASVRLSAAGLVASAVGNTWNPAVQGASASGTYTASGAGAVLDVSSGSGSNYSIAAGSLRLAANP